jgi:predicted alpha/beta-fold hydrolase
MERSLQAPSVTFRSDFRPLPLLGNRHVQTVLAFILTGPSFDHPSRSVPVTLPDGDQIVLHDSVPAAWSNGDPVALVIHGLGGSHRSSHVERQASELLARRVRVVRVDMRTCGAGLALARHIYNAGCSGDLRVAAEEVHSWAPESPIYLVGQSLGGNVALKLAGEAADDPVPSLAGVVAIGPPIDLVACSELIALPRNVVYERFFLRNLLAHLQQHRRCFPELPLPRFPQRLTIRQFDDLFTAPSHGFATALDYYRHASSFFLIPQISVPTLIVTARDDPFIAVEPFERLRVPAHIDVHILDHGGHLGFVGWDGAGGIRWSERRIADWVARQV